jgi:hypothetical protein
VIERKPRTPVKYMRCDCCARYAHKRSLRQWCVGCEYEFAVVVEWLRRSA